MDECVGVGGDQDVTVRILDSYRLIDDADNFFRLHIQDAVFVTAESVKVV
jgi:hypothetical protein